MTTAKTMYATRDFSDAGTERNFDAGQKVDVDAATMANYQAAGLVTDVAPKSEKPAA